MKNNLNKSLFILLIFGLVIVKAHLAMSAYVPMEIKPELASRLGDWYLEKELEISEDALAVLGTRSAALGVYANYQDEKIQLYILESLGRRSSIHQPEFCYAGSGKNDIVEKGVLSVNLEENKKFSANYFILDTDFGYQVVLYTYTVNDLITSNYFKQQIYFVLKRFNEKKVVGRLIRVAKFSQNNDFKHQLLMLQNIAREEVMHLKMADINTL